MQPISEFESALSALRPSASELKLEPLIYQAGYQAGRRALRQWQAGSVAVSAILLVCLSLSLMGRSHPITPVPGSEVNTIAQQENTHPLPKTVQGEPVILNSDDSPFTYLAQRELAIDGNMDDLPESNGSSRAYCLRTNTL